MRPHLTFHNQILSPRIFFHLRELAFLGLSSLAAWIELFFPDFLDLGLACLFLTQFLVWLVFWIKCNRLFSSGNCYFALRTLSGILNCAQESRSHGPARFRLGTCCLRGVYDFSTAISSGNLRWLEIGSGSRSSGGSVWNLSVGNQGNCVEFHCPKNSSPNPHRVSRFPPQAWLWDFFLSIPETQALHSVHPNQHCVLNNCYHYPST